MVAEIRKLKSLTVEGVANYCGMHRNTLGKLRKPDHPSEPDTLRLLVDGWRQAHREKDGYGNETPEEKLRQIMGALDAMNPASRLRLADEIHDTVMKALAEDMKRRFMTPTASGQQPINKQPSGSMLPPGNNEYGKTDENDSTRD